MEYFFRRIDDLTIKCIQVEIKTNLYPVKQNFILSIDHNSILNYFACCTTSKTVEQEDDIYAILCECVFTNMTNLKCILSYFISDC